MSTLVTLATAGMLVIPLTACQNADQADTGKKLDQINQRLARMETAIKTMGRPAGARARAPERRRARPPGPNAEATYAVPIDGAPWVGAADAKVTVVKAFEFACPFCQRVRPTIDQLLADYKGDIKVVYKHYVVHPQTATVPALAACAAGRQGKFKGMYDLIWSKAYGAGRNFARDHMDTLAEEVGLDMRKYKADMEGYCKTFVRKDQAELSRVGARGTPAFFINGRFLSGARPVQQFKTLIDQELNKAKGRIGKGTRASDYYAEWVLKKGKKAL